MNSVSDVAGRGPPTRELPSDTMCLFTAVTRFCRPGWHELSLTVGAAAFQHNGRLMVQVERPKPGAGMQEVFGELAGLAMFKRIVCYARQSLNGDYVKMRPSALAHCLVAEFGPEVILQGSDGSRFFDPQFCNVSATDYRSGASVAKTAM